MLLIGVALFSLSSKLHTGKSKGWKRDELTPLCDVVFTLGYHRDFEHDCASALANSTKTQNDPAAHLTIHSCPRANERDMKRSSSNILCPMAAVSKSKAETGTGIENETSVETECGTEIRIKSMTEIEIRNSTRIESGDEIGIDLAAFDI
ncbi:hypothetical protein EVAR_64136_1 [Eumeta japonica]|uniref:Uncharacterized protein n=1 Tax=Eumeta variegata TaxID=151549 RepID=A0A4C2A5K1_EUMVA|nr:hypothetical protein EVAR_64136_1 [Eumeta japonica]